MKPTRFGGLVSKKCLYERLFKTICKVYINTLRSKLATIYPHLEDIIFLALLAEGGVI